MTRVFRDDLTGDEYPTDQWLQQFGIVAHGDLIATFDVSDETVRENPEEVAQMLHKQVEEWLDQYQEALAGQQGGEQP